MLVPSMLNMADVMADSGYTEEQVFDLGISGTIVFLVVVPLVGACRVPIEALSHFMAGADDYTTEGMPEHYSKALSGRWTIKRDRLRILPDSWAKWQTYAEEVDALSEPLPQSGQGAPASEHGNTLKGATVKTIRVFDRATAERLALFCPQEWVYSDSDGLHVKEHIRQGDCSPTQGLNWTPACDMEGWPDAPDAAIYPALPIPFTARQLAAFMLDGVGRDIAGRFGEFDDGPDEDELQGLGIEAGRAREALRAAYKAIRQATARVGGMDNELQNRAYAARVSYGDARGLALERERVFEPKGEKQTEAEYVAECSKRLKLAVDPLEVQKAEAGRLSAEAYVAWRKWRRDMVRALLGAEQVAPATEAVQGAPVVTEPSRDGSAFRDMAGLSASELSIAFVGDKNESGLGANNMLDVSARGQKKRIPLAALDLVDRRSGNLNGEGGVLLVLAQGSHPRKSDANTQRMKRLRTVFKHHFGIDKDPFERYMKSTGWVPLFKITDRRGAADERAQKQAEERTVSLEQLTEQGVQLPDRSNDDADSWMKENGHKY